MRTQVILQQLPLHFTRSSPWKPAKSPAQLLPTTPIFLSATRTWKLQAEAKGFTGRQANMQGPKSMGKESLARKSGDRRSDGDDDGDEKITEVVMKRMIGRILLSVGVPLVIGFAFLKIFDAAKEKQLWDVPIWLPFLTTFLTFGASTLGIAYGSLSASWDPEKRGSLLGFEQAEKNWVEMWRDEVESKS